MKSLLLPALTIIIVLLLCIYTFAPALVEQQLNRVVLHAPYLPSERARLLHKDLIIGDWHADSLMWDRDLSKPHDYGHVDIPRMQQGNVALQMFTTVTKSPSGLNYERNEAQASDSITKLAMLHRWPLATWNSLTARAVTQAQTLHKLARQDSQNFMLIRSQQELTGFLQKRAANPNMVAGLLGTEGSHALDGKLDNIQLLFDNGFRMMSLHHFFDNKLGGSLHGVSQNGLTAFGRDALQTMQNLGIIIDVSHSSEQVVEDVLSLSDKPLIVSHTGFQGHCQSPRNISDRLMKSIATKGGLIAVGYWDGAICATHPSQVAAAIKYGIDLVGEEHISLGSDFDGATTVAFDASELLVVTHELLEIGLSETQIRKVMGENMLRFLQQNLPIK